MILIFCVSGISINAQTTALTYQGRLTDNSMAADGSYQMRFSLFDAASGGTQDGSTVELTNVNVSNGIFTVELNFGSTAFINGANRFLQIEVRRNSGETYTSLTPRQQVTSTPYSIRSLSTDIADDSNQLGGINSTQYVITTDPRLSDARTPTAGSNNYIQNRTTTQTGANFDIGGTGEANILSANTQFNIGNSRILSSPGTLNTFVGIGNGNANTSGERNTFVGRNTGSNNTTGTTNTFVGSGAGYENINGSNNSFYGYNSGLRVTSGMFNSFFGVSSGSANLTGDSNSFYGFESGLLTTSSFNSFFGRHSGRGTTSGVSNSFFGVDTGLANTSGSNNTALGSRADMGAGNLSFATAIGAGSVVNTSNTITLGRADRSDTVFIPGNLNMGGNTGINWQSGNNKVQVGDCEGDGVPGIRMSIVSNENICDAGGIVAFGPNISISASGIGEVRIGTNANGIRIVNNGFVYARQTTGGSDHVCTTFVTVGGGGSLPVLSTCSSSRRYKSNILDFNTGRSILNRLRPVSFNWKNDGRLDFGLVAEEVAEIEPLLVTFNDKGEVEGVKYDRIGVVLINAVNEQQDQIEEQAEENKQLQIKIETLETQLDEQKRLVENMRLLVCTNKPEAEICRSENEEKKDGK